MIIDGLNYELTDEAQKIVNEKLEEFKNGMKNMSELKHIPTNLEALSFSIRLKELYKQYGTITK